MEKRKKNRLQSSWLQQQHASQESSRTKSGASKNFIFQQTDVSCMTGIKIIAAL
jgi:hypothetical protein